MTGARPRGNNNTLSSVMTVQERLIHRLGIAFTHTKREESRNIKSKEGVGMREREGEKEAMLKLALFQKPRLRDNHKKQYQKAVVFENQISLSY